MIHQYLFNCGSVELSTRPPLFDMMFCIELLHLVWKISLKLGQTVVPRAQNACVQLRWGVKVDDIHIFLALTDIEWRKFDTVVILEIFPV